MPNSSSSSVCVCAHVARCMCTCECVALQPPNPLLRSRWCRHSGGWLPGTLAAILRLTEPTRWSAHHLAVPINHSLGSSAAVEPPYTGVSEEGAEPIWGSASRKGSDCASCLFVSYTVWGQDCIEGPISKWEIVTLALDERLLLLYRCLSADWHRQLLQKLVVIPGCLIRSLFCKASHLVGVIRLSDLYTIAGSILKMTVSGVFKNVFM